MSMGVADDREAGLSFIELLVVLVLLGVLAAIAVPTYLGQRERAQEAALRSDLRNAAVAMESYFAAAGRYPTEAQLALESLGLPESSGVSLAIAVPQLADSGQTFCLTGAHEQIDDGAISMTYAPERGGLSDLVTCP